MPQSLSGVYIHLVSSTKNRQPFLRDKDLRENLHSQLGGISKKLDCVPILIGGVEKHARILARFGRTITQAKWAKELKRVSKPVAQKEILNSGFRMAGRLRRLFGKRVKFGTSPYWSQRSRGGNVGLEDETALR